MLHIYNMPRGSGKTTMIKVKMLEDDFNCTLIVPYEYFKLFYPEEIRDNIFTFDEVLSGEIFTRATKYRGKNLYIDEAFVKDETLTAQLFYYLGKYLSDDNIIAFGTSKVFKKETGETIWL